MCIIVVKDAYQIMPDYAVLKMCFANNPDGAGFMIQRHGEKTLMIDKGFFTFESFWNALWAYKPQFCDIVVMHFRIATSGRVDEATCHPFPISTDVAHLRAPQIVCTSAIAHNGVLGLGTKDLSDTMIYVRDVLAPAYGAGKKIDPIPPGNKLCLLDAERNTMMLHGEWIDDNGIKYSNHSYKSYIWDYIPKGGTDVDIDEVFTPGLCPVCETSRCKLISKHHGLYECKACYTIFNDYGDAIL